MRWQGKKAALLRRHTPEAMALVLGLCPPLPASAACDAESANPVGRRQRYRAPGAAHRRSLRGRDPKASRRDQERCPRRRRDTWPHYERGVDARWLHAGDGEPSGRLPLRRAAACRGHGRRRDATVLIDRRYRRGSCQYDAILTHERQHVQIRNARYSSRPAGCWRSG